MNAHGFDIRRALRWQQFAGTCMAGQGSLAIYTGITMDKPWLFCAGFFVAGYGFGLLLNAYLLRRAYDSR